jgi:hypothetical protein
MGLSLMKAAQAVVCWGRVQEIRASARFCQMWDSTALDPRLSLLQQIPTSVMIIYTLYSQRSRSVDSHICQNRADMGHPSFVTPQREECTL